MSFNGLFMEAGRFSHHRQSERKRPRRLRHQRSKRRSARVAKVRPIASCDQRKRSTITRSETHWGLNCFSQINFIALFHLQINDVENNNLFLLSIISIVKWKRAKVLEFAENVETNAQVVACYERAIIDNAMEGLY